MDLSTNIIQTSTFMDQKTAELANPDYKFEIMLSEDGSGCGAALIAAVAVRQQEELKRRRQKHPVMNGCGAILLPLRIMLLLLLEVVTFSLSLPLP